MTNAGPTVARLIEHMKALKASDPFCTPATMYPGAQIPTQCAVRSKSLPRHTFSKLLLTNTVVHAASNPQWGLLTVELGS